MQFAVIGLGQFGFKVATTLAQMGGEVIAIDSNRERVEEIKDQVTQAVCLDSTDEKALRAAGIQDMDAVVVAIGENIETSILTTALLKRLKVKRIIARASTNLQGQVLAEVGAEKVIYPEDQMGEQVARSIIAPHILQHITLQTGHSLVQIVPKKEFIGKTIKEINFRAKYGVNIIAIHRKVPTITETGESGFRIEVNDLPNPDDRIEETDILVVVGSDEKIEKLARETEEGEK
ncbi:MAG TPA: TrkA family potassium uptake protein [Candidatus Latescibacteria bacterium]|nr:TrkA family potassium uptake protein [Candidatus Latescibacterota bacterium]